MVAIFFATTDALPMNLFLLIDGYNLMHAAGLARRRYGHGDLQRCRRQLQILLKSLLEESAQKRTTVVYDAFRSPSDAGRHQQDGSLRIVFAPKGTDADSTIERLLNSASAPKQTLVVSSDHRLHKAARRRKARAIDSEDFLADLQHSADPLPSQTPEKPEFMSATEIEKLANEIAREDTTEKDSTDFSDDYLDEIQREIDGLT